MTDHTENNPSLLTSRQWAYKKNHSTEHLILNMTGKWRTAADGKVVGIVFIDFKKAFDSIPHHQLLFKLQGTGIFGTLLTWIKNYPTDMSQYTTIGKIN